MAKEPTHGALRAAQEAIAAWRVAAEAVVSRMAALRPVLDELHRAGVAVNATSGPLNVIAFSDPEGLALVRPLWEVLFPVAGRVTMDAAIAEALAKIAAAVAHPANLAHPNEPA